MVVAQYLSAGGEGLLEELVGAVPVAEVSAGHGEWFIDCRVSG